MKILTNYEWFSFSQALPCFPWPPASSKAIVWSNYCSLMDDHASTCAQECDSFSITEVCGFFFFLTTALGKLRNLDIFCIFGVSAGGISRIPKHWWWPWRAHDESWQKVPLRGVNGAKKRARRKTVVSQRQKWDNSLRQDGYYCKIAAGWIIIKSAIFAWAMFPYASCQL